MQTKRISDVSKDLGVSSQTIRNYLKIGDKFFSPTATRKTRKLFTAEDIVQLRSIKSHLAEGVSYVDIPDYLMPAPQVVDTGKDTQEPEVTPEIETPKTSAIERQYQQLLTAQQLGHEREIKRIENEITSKNEFIDYLQRDNDRLRQDNTNLRLPWYRRLFGDRAK